MCAVVRKGGGEASAGERIGQLLGLEKQIDRMSRSDIRSIVISGSCPDVATLAAGVNAARPRSGISQTKLRETKPVETKLRDNRLPAAGIDDFVGSRRRAKREWVDAATEPDGALIAMKI